MPPGRCHKVVKGGFHKSGVLLYDTVNVSPSAGHIPLYPAQSSKSARLPRASQYSWYWLSSKEDDTPPYESSLCNDCFAFAFLKCTPSG